MVDLTDCHIPDSPGRFDCLHRVIGAGTVYLYPVLKMVIVKKPL
jgi:hypothetical protein